MTTSNKIIAGIAILALVVAFWAKFTPATVVTSFGTTNSTGGVSNTNAPAANTVLTNGVLLPNPSVFDYLVSRVFLYTDNALGFGNATKVPILQQAARNTFNGSTGTLCSDQSPFTTASSTYELSINIASTSAASNTIVVAVGSTNGSLATASTTANGAFTIAANQGGQFFTSGTTTTAAFGIVGPSQYVNITTSGTSAGTQLGGSCGTIFTSDN